MELRNKDGRIRVRVLVFALVVLMAVAGAVIAGTWETRMAQAQGGSLLDDDLVTGTIDLAAASADYTLPRPGDPYIVCARGNRAFVECGSTPTVTTAAGGYVFSVPDGTCLGPFRLSGPKCAHIATSAVGQIEFLHLDPGL
jgi:hypothetical protein